VKALLSAIVCLILMAPAAVAHSFLHKPSGALRVMTWNIGANSIFPEAPGPDTASVGRPARFRRVIRALHPDILCLQEVSRGPRESAALLDELLPLAGGGGWQSHGVLTTVADFLPVRK